LGEHKPQHLVGGADWLPEFDPHSPRARGLDTWWWRAKWEALDFYGKEGAWGELWTELENAKPPPPPPRPAGSARGRGQDGGAWPSRHKWYTRLSEYGFSVRLAFRPSAPPPPAPSGPLVRRSMERSTRRLWAVTYLLEGHVRPTHMLTLTLPRSVWEELPSNEARLERWRSALDRFLLALKVRLRRRFGSSWGWLWWLEFQPRRRSGLPAPHLHILLDLGGWLSREEWEDWRDWITAAWSRALGVPAPYAPTFEALRKKDFRYVRKYLRKAKQKEFPFPGPWGRSWGVAGRWLEALREARRSPCSEYALTHEELLALFYLAADTRWAEAPFSPSSADRSAARTADGFGAMGASALPDLAFAPLSIEWLEGIIPLLNSLYPVATAAATHLGMPPPLAKPEETPPRLTRSLRCKFYFPAYLRDWLSGWLAVLLSDLKGGFSRPTSAIGGYG